MKLQGAIFDMDGTLLDSMDFWSQLGRLYLESKGIISKPELEEDLAFLSMEECAGYFRREYGINGSDSQIAAEINRMTENKYMNSFSLKPGVRELLDSLKQSGVTMCVATATDRYLAEAALRRLDVYKYFSALFTCSETGLSKREPDIYILAAEQMGAEISRTAVFEDAPHALKAAKKAGFITVAVEDPVWHELRDEIKASADIYIESFLQDKLLEL